jgi:hypothetical protein
LDLAKNYKKFSPHTPNKKINQKWLKLTQHTPNKIVKNSLKCVKNFLIGDIKKIL